jgi:lipopolysaccharide transport system ATP-binding protein
LQGSTRKRAESFLDDIAEFSELGDSFNEPVKNYSSGMRARLAFTTALMTHVDVLLIDEILSVGDAHFRGKAQEAMKNRITGEQTVVFVSHMADQVKDLCDRVIWLDKGKIIAQGDSAEVVDAYTQHVTQARVDGAPRQTDLQQQFEAKLQADPKLRAAFKQQIEAKLKADAQQQADTKQ